jgi:hypothetical protein
LKRSSIFSGVGIIELRKSKEIEKSKSPLLEKDYSYGTSESNDEFKKKFSLLKT